MLQRSFDQADSPERSQQEATPTKRWGATSGLVTSPYPSPAIASSIPSPAILGASTLPEASPQTMELATPDGESTEPIETDAAVQLEEAQNDGNPINKAPDSDPDLALTAEASEVGSSNYAGEGETVELEAAEPVDEHPTVEDAVGEDERGAKAVASPAKPASSFPLGPIQCHNIDVEEMRAVAAQLLPAIARAVIEQVGKQHVGRPRRS